jgi:hypothetical protein
LKFLEIQNIILKCSNFRSHLPNVYYTKNVISWLVLIMATNG